MALTVKQVERIQKAGRYFDDDGLYLQVTDKGAKSWLLRYAHDRRERWMGLGSARDFKLDEARERARRARQQLADGVDPIDQRRAARAEQTTAAAKQATANTTFADVAEKFAHFHSKQWTSLKHAKQFMSRLRQYAYPVIGKVLVASIDSTMIIAILEPIWHKKRSTAARLQNAMERVLDYAKSNKYRDGDNPAAWTKNLEHALPGGGKVAHHPALPYRETHDFMVKLRALESTTARALEFTILTAVRTEETRGAVWQEFDMAKRVWTIPAVRMKSDREHRVPLCDRVIQILQALPPDGEHVFPGAVTGGKMGMNAMASLLHKRLRRDVTVHGFRSTFRDWAADCSSAKDDVVERALAHAVGSQTEKAYKRTDLFVRRVKLMADWAHYVEQPPAADNVVPIKQPA